MDEPNSTCAHNSISATMQLSMSVKHWWVTSQPNEPTLQPVSELHSCSSWQGYQTIKLDVAIIILA